MKGLLIKDLSVLTQKMRVFLLMIVFLAVLPNSNMVFFSIIYAAMMPYTTLAYDERSKWDQLADVMPYSKKEIVLSKYVLGWCFVAGAFLISMAARIVESHLHLGSASLTGIILSVCVAVIMMDVTLPPMFRLGVERGRMLFILIMVLLACGGAGLVEGVVGNADARALLSMLKFVLPSAAVVLTLISVPLSIRLYASRDR